MKFLDGLDSDLRDALLGQLKSLWTHESTALEGNTLSLGETDFVIREGLTVSGKPLKDHQEVVGHARAIDLLYDSLKKGQLKEQDLFKLHTAVQTNIVVDVFAPVGAWKQESNGTYALTADNQRVFIDFSDPKHVPQAMAHWLLLANRLMKETLSKQQVIDAFAQLHLAFVHIHPFQDGNGRMARLLSNLPALKAGYPPILIANKNRKQYLQLLSEYQMRVPLPSDTQPILPDFQETTAFADFCRECWQDTITLVQEAHDQQAKRT